MAEPKTKACLDCGMNLPATAEHFKRLKTGGLDGRCLICRQKKQRGLRVEQRERSLRDIEVGAVASFMTAAQSGGENIPHSCEVLERLMEYFGGVSGFSSLLVKQYFDSPPGGATRTKMLDSVLRLVVRNTDQGGAKKPLGQWTDNELETELDQRLRVVAAQFQGRIIDATPQGQGTPATAVGIEDQRLPGQPAQGTSGRARRSKNRGAQALPPDAGPGADARLPGE